MIRYRLNVLTLILLALATAGCPKPADDGPRDRARVERPSVSIMTFNVENLFDNADDPDKADETFLPLSAKKSAAHIAACNEIAVESWRNQCLYLDWSDDAVERKLAVLAEVIRQVDDGRGADIIAFQEVENAAILDRLSLDYLPDLGYGAAILIEGADVRGIDVAFLSRLPQTEAPVLQPMTFDGFEDRQGDTRGVLQATFMLPDGSMLTGFAVHFPAPFHPMAMRVQAYQQLKRLRDALPDDRSVFAAGDFNTVRNEMYDKGLLDDYVRPYWVVAHDSCDGCRGSYYYPRDDAWSFLDMILFSPARGEKATWRLRAGSVKIANAVPNQVTAGGTPRRFQPESGTGVSDHWPLLARIEPAEKQ
jgi:Endonuclease/Exonuclease/phosphatase family